MSALPEAETLLKQLVAGIGQPFYVVDRDWRFIFYNDEAARYFRRPASEMLGRILWDVFPGEREQERGRLLRRAMDDRQAVTGEAPSMIANRLVSYSMFPLGDGLGVIFHDVSERRDAQEALRARSAALEAVLDTIPTAVWFTHDPEVREVVRNRRAAEILRVPPGGGEPLAVLPRRTFRFQRAGRDLAAEELPLRRAARGETVEGELMELVHDNGDRRILLTRAAPLRGEDGAVFGAVCAAADVTERHQYEGRLKLLLDELDHRVKNTLTIVQSIAALTLKDVDAATRKGFEGRLMTLGEVHGLLTRSNWAAAELADVLRAALRSLVPAPDRVSLQGASLRLQPRTAVTLSLAAHELATNAIKYGALSTAGGRIAVGWTIDGERFRLSWTESGGPPVRPPARQGFGTRMIEQALAGELRGEVTMDYRPEGLVCTIDGPLAAVQDGADHPPSA